MPLHQYDDSGTLSPRVNDTCVPPWFGSMGRFMTPPVVAIAPWNYLLKPAQQTPPIVVVSQESAHSASVHLKPTGVNW